MTVKVPVDTLPELSVACTVTVLVPSGKVEPEGGSITTVTVWLLSVALTVYCTTALVTSTGTTTTMSSGRCSTGFSVSTTVMVKLLVVWLPAASVPTATTVVVPSGKDEPEGGVTTRVAPGTLSWMPTTKFTTAVFWPGSVGTMIGPGTVTTGGSRSATWTIKLPLAELPAPSAAVQLTGVAPSGKTDPLAGLQAMLTPEQLSLPLTLKFTTAVLLPASVATLSAAGRCSTGFSRSSMVTVKLLVALLPAASVATQTTMVVPKGKVDPEGGVHSTTTWPGSLSTAVTVNVTTAAH